MQCHNHVTIQMTSLTDQHFSRPIAFSTILEIWYSTVLYCTVHTVCPPYSISGLEHLEPGNGFTIAPCPVDITWLHLYQCAHPTQRRDLERRVLHSLVNYYYTEPTHNPHLIIRLPSADQYQGSQISRLWSFYLVWIIKLWQVSRHPRKALFEEVLLRSRQDFHLCFCLLLGTKVFEVGFYYFLLIPNGFCFQLGGLSSSRLFSFTSRPFHPDK
jgi:hypothetical protein